MKTVKKRGFPPAPLMMNDGDGGGPQRRRRDVDDVVDVVYYLRLIGLLSEAPPAQRRRDRKNKKESPKSPFSFLFFFFFAKAQRWRIWKQKKNSVKREWVWRNRMERTRKKNSVEKLDKRHSFGKQKPVDPMLPSFYRVLAANWGSHVHRMWLDRFFRSLLRFTEFFCLFFTEFHWLPLPPLSIQLFQKNMVAHVKYQKKKPKNQNENQIRWASKSTPTPTPPPARPIDRKRHAWWNRQRPKKEKKNTVKKTR